MMSINILNFILYSTSKGPVTLGNLLEFIFILSFSIIISRIIILYLRRYFKNKVSKDVGETTIKFLYYGFPNWKSPGWRQSRAAGRFISTASSATRRYSRAPRWRRASRSRDRPSSRNSARPRSCFPARN